MIRYTVVWAHAAEAELAKMWFSSSQRSQLTSAADSIDKELAIDAHLKGIDLSEGLRVLTVSMLSVFFTISPDDRLVRVWAVGVLDG